MISQTELVQRLVMASIPPVPLSGATKARHQSRIAASLVEAQASPIPSFSRRRRAAVAALAAVVSTAGPGLVAYAQQALPGEPLYGLKRGSENVLVIFDADIRARHRIAELEMLAGSDQDLTKNLAEAEAELEDVEDEELLTRWSVIVGDIEDDEADEESEEAEEATVTTVASEADDSEAASDEEANADDETNNSDDGQSSDDESQSGDDEQTDTTGDEDESDSDADGDSDGSDEDGSSEGEEG